MKLNITSRDLLRLVDPVLPCAHKDLDLPVLNCVAIETHGKYVTAVATDRFKLGWQRVELESPGEFKALIKVSTVKSILALFKATRFSNPELTLTADNGDLIVEQTGGLSIGGFHEARMRFALGDGEFPKVASLIRESLERETESGPVAFNWQFLSAFVKASGENGGQLVVKTHPSKPTVITDNRDFVGILMPRRLITADGAPASIDLDDDWHAMFAEKPAPKKRTRKKAGAA